MRYYSYVIVAYINGLQWTCGVAWIIIVIYSYLWPILYIYTYKYHKIPKYGVR